MKQFADKFERDGGRLDILVENAAVALFEYSATGDNWETSFVVLLITLPNALTRHHDGSLQVNHLSTSLLALLLLPAMIKTAQQHSTSPRLVVVSSDMHYWVKMDKNLSENPDILKTLGSAEYCTEKYATNLKTPETQLTLHKKHEGKISSLEVFVFKI